jgi:hypothetical protein
MYKYKPGQIYRSREGYNIIIKGYKAHAVFSSDVIYYEPIGEGTEYDYLLKDLLFFSEYSPFAMGLTLVMDIDQELDKL